MDRPFEGLLEQSLVTEEQIKMLAAVLAKPPVRIYPETLLRCEWAVNTLRDIQHVERIKA